MKKIWIRDIKDYEGKEVTLQGWLYNKRSSGKLHFLQLRDGTAEIQAVVFKGNVSDITRIIFISSFKLLYSKVMFLMKFLNRQIEFRRKVP